jgi:ubiquinone/menaquinone biosynthesis C-methylase UbiE
MSQLYSKLSAVYEAMYQSFINYEEEFSFYHQIIARHHARSVTEIGCGTGKLAAKFSAAGINYTGLDMSDEMLQIAQKNNPDCSFIKGDMRNFVLQQKQMSFIITGRTISYLITNEDVLKTFQSINQNLEEGGIVCFDCINAETFMPRIKDGEEIVHTAVYNNKQYERKSLWSINLQHGFCFNWVSDYYEVTATGKLIELGRDDSVIRTFTKDEMTVFLSLAGFKVIDCVQRPSYAFDTFVITAKKQTD